MARSIQRWLLVSIALSAGCYRAHDHAADADADVAPLPSCDRPVAEWRETYSVLPGAHSAGAARLRAGDDTRIAAFSDERGMEILRFSFQQLVPRLDSAQQVDGAATAVPVAGDRDAERSIIAARDPSVDDRLTVFSVDEHGNPSLAPTDFETHAFAHTTVSVGPDYYALAASSGGYDLSQAWVRAYDPEASIRIPTTLREGWLALGGARPDAVTMLRTDENGGATEIVDMLWPGGLVVVRSAFERSLHRLTHDGSRWIGVTAWGSLWIRDEDRLDRIGMIDPEQLSVAPSIAVHEGASWVVAAVGDDLQFFTDEGAFSTRAIPGVSGDPEIRAVIAHASPTQRGAFVVADAIPALVWVGWSCDPTP